MLVIWNMKDVEVIGRLRFEDLAKLVEAGKRKIFLLRPHFLPYGMCRVSRIGMFLSLCSKSGKEYAVSHEYVLRQKRKYLTVQAVDLQMAKRK